MESTLSPEKAIEYITAPAFLAKDGFVTAVNQAAAKLKIKVGTSVSELICVGADDFAAFSAERLYLELTVGRAWVSHYGDMQLFAVEDTYANAELKALALAAQHLREPLSNAMSGIELLKQNTSVEGNETLKQQISSINRSVHALLRSVCNMSDASAVDIGSKANLQLQNATSVFFEISEKLSSYAEQSGRTLKFTGLKKPVECVMDPQLMERAILNMISNAIKFSPADSTIKFTVKQTGCRLSVTVENKMEKNRQGIYHTAFQQFRRSPTIEDGLSGIGLGMSIITGVMNVHSGTVLLDTARNNSRITLSFPLTPKGNPAVRSPIKLLGGYTGGINAYLVELADVLPNHFYE